MATQHNGVSDERKTAPMYLVLEGEMELDAPMDQVWQHLINYPSWQNYSTVQHISGTPGQEGEVVLLKKEEGNIPTTPYYAITVKLDPGRRVIWKTYRDNTSNFGIVDFMVRKAGNKTLFYYNSLYEHSVPYESESQLQATRKQQQELLETLSAGVFAKLKKLVEKST